MFKKNLKLFIGIIIGAVVFGSIGAYAASKIYANNVTVDTTNMSELGASSDVNAALTYLYGKAASIRGGGPSIYPTINANVNIIYLDPTNINAVCDVANTESYTGKKTGCMKWYAYKTIGSETESTTDDKFIAILDHNTTDKVQWNSSNSNKTQREVATAFLNDTSGWNSSLNARLITADEIVKIIGADDYGFVVSTASDQVYFDSGTRYEPNITYKGQSHYSWLIDYTYDCIRDGCNVVDSNTVGYWTSTPSPNNGTEYVWGIFYNGMLIYISANDTRLGIRPVIEVPKSLFN